MASFIINGGIPLKGEVQISGSKNAALPILAATLLTDQPCTITNVPDIADTHSMVGILRAMGSEVKFRKNTISIQTGAGLLSGVATQTGHRLDKGPRIFQKNIPVDLVSKMRASVLLLGPLLARMGKVDIPYPGGCVLGARAVDTHVTVMQALEVRLRKSAETRIVMEGRPQAAEIVLPEFSVTGTENALMAASLTPGKTIIHLAAIEPHVQDLCHFLIELGVGVEGIGTHTLTVRGKKKLHGARHRVTADYLEAGTFILAAILTHGNVKIHHVPTHDLDAFWNLLREMKVDFKLGRDSVHITPSKNWTSCRRLQTNVFPGFPTDLQPPFAVLLTQARGESRLHETLFEGRFNYFPELIKMGAKIEKINPHEALVTGPTPLRGGTEVKSWDIRAGAAMLLAALTAKGKTRVSHIHYIDRGYERFDEKLRLLGAQITREN